MPAPTGGLVVFEALCTFHRKILCADRQYVTQNFDTKQAGRRIFEISVYRPGKFDAHTMTLRQDGGFSAERKMSQLATPQDLLPQDSLRAARNLLHNAHQSKANAICDPRLAKIGRRERGRARIFAQVAAHKEKKNGQKSRGRARILPWATTSEEKKN